MAKQGIDPVYVEALSITETVGAAQVFGTDFNAGDFVNIGYCGMVYSEPAGWKPRLPIIPAELMNEFDELEFSFGLPELDDTTAATLAVWVLMPNNKARFLETSVMAAGVFPRVTIARTQEPLFISVHAITTTGDGITGLDVFLAGKYKTDVAPLAS